MRQIRALIQARNVTVYVTLLQISAIYNVCKYTYIENIIMD